MSKIGDFRSIGRKAKRSKVTANPFFRVIAYVIDVILIRFIFEGIVFLLATRGLISASWMRSISLYLGQGLAPFRGGGLLLKHFIFINTFQDVILHLSYSALFMGYFISLESGRIGGQTLGKKIMGIKVVDKHGSKISLRRSVLRNSTKYLYRVPILNFIVAFLDVVLLFFAYARTGDILADTEVVTVSGKGVVELLLGNR